MEKGIKDRWWEEKPDSEMTDGDMSVSESTAGASGGFRQTGQVN